jgi:hypothetical protein
MYCHAGMVIVAKQDVDLNEKTVLKKDAKAVAVGFNVWMGKQLVLLQPHRDKKQYWSDLSLFEVKK